MSLPNRWQTMPVSALCTKIQDGTHFSPKGQSQEGPYPYVTAKNVRPWGMAIDDLTFLDEETHRAIYGRCDVREGDVLLVKDGVNAGDTALNTIPGEISLLSSVCFLRTGELLAAPYLRYYLQSPVGRRYLLGNLSGSAIRRIILERVRGLPVILAPLSEQHCIVAAIETQFSRLDAAVAALKRAKANVKRARASVLKAAVEGRLVPTEAELARTEGRHFEPASILLDRILTERQAAWTTSGARGKYQEPTLPVEIGLPKLPRGWCWVTPPQVTAGERYDLAIGPFGSNLKVTDYRGDGVPLVFVRHVRAERFRGLDDKFINRQKADELHAHRVNGGEIVITKMGEPPGDAALYPVSAPAAVITADVVKWRTSNAVNAKFLVHATGSSMVRRQIIAATRGVAQKKISLERFAGLAYPLPPLAEQHRIVAEVDRRLSVLDTLETTIEASLARCARLRQSILQRAFEGRLVPADLSLASAPPPLAVQQGVPHD